MRSNKASRLSVDHERQPRMIKGHTGGRTISLISQAFTLRKEGKEAFTLE